MAGQPASRQPDAAQEDDESLAHTSRYRDLFVTFVICAARVPRLRSLYPIE
jgi:hypothetical protein